MTRLAALGAAFALVLLAAPALAQAPIAGPTHTPTEAEVAEARSLYQAGNTAAESAQFADALESFRRAYGLSGNPAALYNVAKTLRALGRHVEARDAFDQLLTEYREISDATRTEATALRDGEAGRIAVLTVIDLPAPAADLLLRLDGTGRTDSGERPLTLDVDPGHHGLLVSREHFVPFTWEGTLGDGQHDSVHVTLNPEPTGRSIFEEPVFWVIAGVVVVGAAVITGYLLWQGAQLRPEQPPAGTIHL